MRGGFIKLHRKMTEWGWYSDANTMRVFMHILLTASYEDSEYHGIKIKAGQCVTGRKKLAQELRMSESSVRTALEHLKSTNEITIETTNKFSVITVENWRKYQVCEDENDQQNDQQKVQRATNKRPTTDHIKEYKEIKKKRNIIPPQAEWVKEYCKERKNSVDPEAFMDFYQSKNWMVGKSKMKDWEAAVRNWERNRDNSNKPKNIEPPKYKQFEPDPDVDAVQMPDEIRERLGQLF